MRRRCKRQPERGSSLLEVTVALSILLVSMMSSLQTMLFWGTQARTVSHLTQVEQLLETAVENVKAIRLDSLIDGLHGVDPNNGTSTPVYPLVIMYPNTAYQVSTKPFYRDATCCQMVFYDTRMDIRGGGTAFPSSSDTANQNLLRQTGTFLTSLPPVANTALAISTTNLPVEDFSPIMGAIRNIDMETMGGQTPTIQLRGVTQNQVWVVISGRYFPTPTGTGASSGGPNTAIVTVSLRSTWTTNAEVQDIGQLLTTVVRTG